MACTLPPDILHIPRVLLHHFELISVEVQLTIRKYVLFLLSVALATVYVCLGAMHGLLNCFALSQTIAWLEVSGTLVQKLRVESTRLV